MALHPHPMPTWSSSHSPSEIPQRSQLASPKPLGFCLTSHGCSSLALGSLRDGVCTDILRTHGLELEDRERKVPVAPYLSARAVSSSLPSKAEKKTVRWGLLALQRSLGGAAQQGRGSLLLESLTQCYNCLLLLSRPTPMLPASSAKETPRIRTLICGLP